MPPLFWFLLGLTISALAAGAYITSCRRKMEARLNEAERDRACLALAENVGSVATWSVDNRTNKLYWSDRLFAIHGRDKDKGTPDLDSAIDYYHPEDRIKVRRTVSRALAEGRPFHFQARIIDENGIEKSIMSRGICHVGHDGEVDQVFGVAFETAHTISIADFGNDNPDHPMLKGYRVNE